MRATNRLSAGFLKSAPVGKHCDGAGLWLVKRDDGGAQWVLRVTDHGRRREMGLGGFPSLGLAEARKLAERWRNVAAAGRDAASIWAGKYLHADQRGQSQFPSSHLQSEKISVGDLLGEDPSR